jgi:hypothetical protein
MLAFAGSREGRLGSRRRSIALASLIFLIASWAAEAGLYWRAVMVTPAQVARCRTDTREIEALADGPRALRLEKSCQAIHFLLNGDPWSSAGPYGKVILGGQHIGQDSGYGPAKLLTPTEVRDLAAKS